MRECGVYGGRRAALPRGARVARDRLDAAKRLGNPHAAFTIRTNEGLARLPLNELDEAASAFSDAPAVCRDAGAEDLVDETLLGLAAVAASRGDFDRAARRAALALSHQTAERERRGGHGVVAVGRDSRTGARQIRSTASRNAGSRTRIGVMTGAYGRQSPRPRMT